MTLNTKLQVYSFECQDDNVAPNIELKVWARTSNKNKDLDVEMKIWLERQTKNGQRLWMPNKKSDSSDIEMKMWLWTPNWKFTVNLMEKISSKMAFHMS